MFAIRRSPAPSLVRFFSASPTYEFILAARAGAQSNVGLITLNRPKALNALNSRMVAEINAAARAFDADAGVGSIVITGSERAFAAGADIKEMASVTFPSNFTSNMFVHWAELTRITKPTIAAVNGFALGGGCELAMMCDIILAGDKAQFGQPEIMLGTIPGCGGTQRLIRAVGKSKAMEMILTGDYKMGAAEAAASGLVARVVPAEKLLDEALALATRIASHSKATTALCKEATNAAFEMTLAEGVRFERRLFHATFATKDQKEGMAAFVEKRKPTWTDA